MSGLLGSVAALLSVRAGYETAVAACARARRRTPWPSADVGAALGAITHLKDADLGRAGLVLGGADADVPTAATGRGCRPARPTRVDVVEAPDVARDRPCGGCCSRPLSSTTSTPPARLVADLPDVVAVTREGDLVGAHFAAGGSSSQPSLIEVQAAVDEAAEALSAATGATERLRFEVTALETERQEVQRRVDVALAKLHESDAAMAAVAEELGQLGSARPVRHVPRRSGSSPRSPRPRTPATTTWPAWPSWSNGSRPPPRRTGRGARHGRAVTARRGRAAGAPR